LSSGILAGEEILKSYPSLSSEDKF